MIAPVAATASSPQTRTIDPPALAAQMLARHAKGAQHDLAGLRREVEALKAQDAKLGTEVERLVKAGLPVVEQARFEQQATAIRAPDGSTLTIKEGAPTVADYRAMKAGSEGRAFYDRLDRLFGDGDPKTDDTARIDAGINRLLASGMSLEQAEALAKRTAANEPGTDWGKLGLDVTQMALDVVGIFEPTPFADGANTIISIGRGDKWGALASAAGIVPYVGDLAKLGKLGKWAKTIAEAIELVTHNPAARKALEPALRKLYDALKAVPEGALKKLPQEAQDVLAGITKQLDELFTTVTRQFDAGIVRAGERLGLPPAKVQEIVDLGRGKRPDVGTYMSSAAQATHLSKFDDGIVRFTSRSSAAKYGSLGPTGGFVMPASEFKKMMDSAKGDLAIVERQLGLDAGTLRSGDTLIALIERKDATGLRVPSGNEGGANDQWLPGGHTSGGVSEAVMDFTTSTPYKEIKLP